LKDVGYYDAFSLIRIFYFFRVEKHYLHAIQDISMAIKIDAGCQTLKVCVLIGNVLSSCENTVLFLTVFIIFSWINVVK